MPHIYCNSDLAMKDRKLATTQQSNQNKTRQDTIFSATPCCLLHYPPYLSLIIGQIMRGSLFSHLLALSGLK